MSTFCVLWFVHLTRDLLTKFLLNNSSPGDGIMWSIGVV